MPKLETKDKPADEKPKVVDPKSDPVSMDTAAKIARSIDLTRKDPTIKRQDIQSYRPPYDSEVGAVKVAEEAAKRLGVALSGVTHEEGCLVLRLVRAGGASISSITIPPFVHGMEKDAAADYIRDAVRAAAGSGAADPAMRK